MGLLPNTISTAIAPARLRLGKKSRKILCIFLRFFTFASLAQERFRDESAFGNRPPWEKLAQKDPYFYIATSVETVADDTRNFWQSGEKNYQQFILPLLKQYNVANQCALDFGCGVGRYAFPLAGYFKKVIGVDTAETMRRIGRQEAQKRGLNSVEFLDSAEFYSRPLQCDFIYSTHVFQHLENQDEIAKIIERFKEVLRGYAYLHFDTRPKDYAYVLKYLLPDLFLPKTKKRGMRRVRRDVQKLRDMFSECGFQIVKEFNPGTEFHYFFLRHL